MALGIARNAQIAGWSQQAGNLSGVATTSVTTTLANSDNLFVNPSYYADFTPVTTASNFGLGIIASGANLNMNMSSIGTNEYLSFSSLTFQVGTNWMAGLSGYNPGFTVVTQFDNNGTSSFRTSQAYADTNGAINGYRFGSEGGGAFVSATAFNSYRNRWLTLLVASSDSSSDFANWTGGTNPGSGWAFRNVLFDVDTGTKITSSDGWGFSAPDLIDLTQAWTYGVGTSSYGLVHSYYQGSAPANNENEFQILAYQYTIGTVVDVGSPTYYNDLIGTGFATDISSSTPIIGYTMDSAGSAYAGTYGTVGYEQAAPTWSRLPPCNVRINSQFDLNPPEPPVFTSL